MPFACISQLLKRPFVVGGMNGMMDPQGGSDWMGATPGLNQMPLWGDLQKQEHDGYWKHQQQVCDVNSFLGCGL